MNIIQKKYRLSLFLEVLGTNRESFLVNFSTNTGEIIDPKQLQRWNKKSPGRRYREKFYEVLRRANYLDPIRLIAQRGFSIEELVDGIWTPEIDEEEWLSALKRSKPDTHEHVAAFIDTLLIAWRMEGMK